MYQNDPKRVLTPECRLSYCNLVTARAPQNGVGDPKFSVTLLIPKSNPNIKQELDAAMNAAAEVGVNAKWNGVRPARIECRHSRLHDKGCGRRRQLPRAAHPARGGRRKIPCRAHRLRRKA